MNMQWIYGFCVSDVGRKFWKEKQRFQLKLLKVTFIIYKNFIKVSNIDYSRFNYIVRVDSKFKLGGFMRNLDEVRSAKEELKIRLKDLPNCAVGMVGNAKDGYALYVRLEEVVPEGNIPKEFCGFSVKISVVGQARKRRKR
jgi:hypothetical protein